MTADDLRAGGHLGDAASALLDGELDDHAAAAARAHLAGCPSCEAETAAIGQARAWLRGLPPVDPPADFYPRVLDSTRAGRVHEAKVVSLADADSGRERPRHRWRAGVAAMAACAAATVVVLGLVAPHDPPTSPPLGRFIQAHEAEVGPADPVSELATAVVPMGFRR